MILRLLRFLLLVGVVYVLYRVLWKGEGLGFFKRKKKKRSSQAPKAIEEMKKDPVCGTYVPENQAVKYTVNHTTHYFCSEQCKQKFRELKE
jgi:YHS domain-containing protein